MMKKIECVIFDWAGTTVDYGCFAPVSAFVETFAKIGIDVTAKTVSGTVQWLPVTVMSLFPWIC